MYLFSLVCGNEKNVTDSFYNYLIFEINYF